MSQKRAMHNSQLKSKHYISPEEKVCIIKNCRDLLGECGHNTTARKCSGCSEWPQLPRPRPQLMGAGQAGVSLQIEAGHLDGGPAESLGQPGTKWIRQCVSRTGTGTLLEVSRTSTGTLPRGQ